MATEFNKELNNLMESLKDVKDEIMKSQNLETDSDFKSWCKKVLQGTKTFRNLFKVEITIYFKDVAIINFSIPNNK